ncbi:MAG: hypothetical protein AMDU5_GPLC00019G0049 [Thermoplasmatales archaeon Gpl]|nr:MAG: hypothetical protein AMDU5_GPLC00019G0049 [Thermoplasmatales archaeon Gpl]
MWALFIRYGMLSGDETPLTVRREYRTASPIINSRSPTRVTINAFFAAEAAFGLEKPESYKGGMNIVPPVPRTERIQEDWMQV